MGETYAGIDVNYYSYSLPLKICLMSLCDGFWSHAAAMSSVAIGTYMQAHSTRLKVPNDFLKAFDSAHRPCGFDTALQEAAIYPPNGKIHISGNPEYLTTAGVSAWPVP